ASAIEHDTHAAIGFEICVIRRLRDRPHDVRRAAETSQRLLSLPRPAEIDRHRINLPQRVSVEEGGAVEAHAGENAVEQRQLDEIREAWLAGDLEHAPVPEQV